MQNLREIYNKDGIVLYEPTGDYHMSRYIAAGAQNIYSASGATKDYIKSLAESVKAICEDGNHKNIRTDIGTLMNNLLYRVAYPVDEDCAIRMGAIYCLLADENPDIVNPAITEQKVELARKHPELYTFFLTVGIGYTDAWKDIDRDSLTAEWFQHRREKLRGLMPYNPSVNQ